jgi:orotidine-5'-phosphate decarboxylase
MEMTKITLKNTKKEILNAYLESEKKLNIANRTVHDQINEISRLNRKILADRKFHEITETALTSCESANVYLKDKIDSLRTQILNLVEATFGSDNDN